MLRAPLYWIVACIAAGLAFSAAVARPAPSYDIYIFNTPDGGAIYAISAPGQAAAARVEDCAARLLPDSRALVSRLRAMQAREQVSLVIIDGPGSRVRLGRCADADRADHDEPSLVVIRDASPGQTRAILRDIDALSPDMRREIRRTLGL
jgi:hypothetical protein